MPVFFVKSAFTPEAPQKNAFVTRGLEPVIAAATLVKGRYGIFRKEGK
jgi:hypothetical protein